MQLEEQFYESSTARWKRELPWLRLFRGFRMAMDFRKLFLAFVGTLVFSLGMTLFTMLPYSPHSVENAQPQAVAPRPGEIADLSADKAIVAWPWEAEFPGAPWAYGTMSLGEAVSEPWSVGSLILRQSSPLLAPWRVVLDPAQSVVFATSWSGLAWGWTKLLWALSVWAVFGGAMARIAALEIAGEGVPSLKDAIVHSCRFFGSTLGGTLLPVVGVGVFWGGALVIGLLGLIPGIGVFLTGLLWFVSLICGGILAVILIGVAASWPLMYVTIAVEGSDAFDALSRSYSYVFGRPWYALWIALASLVYGAVVLLFLTGATMFAGDLAAHATRVGMGEAHILELSETPRIVELKPGEEETQVLPVTTGAKLRGIWVRGLFMLPTVFVYSYFWVVMTVAYFLLRHAEDATPFKKVYWPQAEQPSAAPALSGIAAAEYRERQAAESAGAATTTSPNPPLGSS